MREIRTSGSEGGAGRKPRSYLYLELRQWADRGGAASLRIWLDLDDQVDFHCDV
jgi:hypothetical protein